MERVFIATMIGICIALLVVVASILFVSIKNGTIETNASLKEKLAVAIQQNKACGCKEIKQ